MFHVPDKPSQLSPVSQASEVADFLAKVASAPAPVAGAGSRGRLLFAMDATASREPTWDHACQIQGEMFATTASLGGLDVQLCHYRGFNEFRASPWVTDARALARQMSAVRCAGGATQIGRVLAHAAQQGRERKLNALVFVGDCMEEDVDRLCTLAGELGLLGIRAFMFQEGHDVTAERVFRNIARLSGGAYCRFDAASARQLADLLAAVAVYAAGGRKALADLGDRSGDTVRQLVHQVFR